MPVTAKEIADSAKEDVYYGVGYSTKDGFSVGAQSIQAQDKYGPPETDPGTKEKSEKVVSQALEKNRSRPVSNAHLSRR